ncbi:MAG: polyhydroxyalkanoate synthesis repressor PhaR [Hyphomicrobiaceae bacterium]
MLSKTDPPGDKKEPVVVKKYANRRLYNTETSTYVTLDDLATMVRAERDFVVFDAKSGEDLTHAVLTQIIVEEESRAGTQTLLPVPFLRQLIRFYGDTMERMVPSYLQVSLDTLAKEQERFRKQFTTAFTPQGAFEAYQEQARKNLAMFEQAVGMFAPFPGAKPGTPEAARSGSEAETPGAPPASATAAPAEAKPAPQPERRKPNELDELKAQLAAMQAKLEKLSSKG